METLTAELPPFTYFRDDTDCIFYARGDVYDVEAETIAATLVYVPVPDAQATRIQATSGIGYDKIIAHGFTSDLPRLQQQLPPVIYDMVTSSMVRDAAGDEFLAVPLSRVAEVYRPQGRLNDILGGNADGLSEISVDKIRAVTNLMASRGIDPSQLGLYGSLQCYINGAGGGITDVDLLIYGCDWYPTVVQLAQENQGSAEIPPNIAADALALAVRTRRVGLSQIHLSGEPAVSVDVKVMDEAVNRRALFSSLSGAAACGEEVSLQAARITDAQASLSMPAAYEIQTQDGARLLVATKHYRSQGAATVGDTVNIRGARTSAGIVALTDPARHHIYDPSLFEAD